MRFDEMFKAATGNQPYEWQRDLALRPEPALVISAPTGTGKTEAVLLDWLWRRRFSPDLAGRARTPRRLVLAMPMRTLVEQTQARIEDALGDLDKAGVLEPPIRTHSLVGGAADDSWILDPSADAVLVGTIDMLLSRALNRGFGRGRASWPIDFGLLNSDCLWILDEVQLMDAAVATSCQLETFRRSFATGAPTRTVWMSATLERSWLETKDHPAPRDDAVARVVPDEQIRARLTAPKVLHRGDAGPGDTEKIAELVLSEHAVAERVEHAPWLTIVLLNTVERAKAVYEAISERLPARTGLVLLHSRFRPTDRQQHVAELGEQFPAGGRIVVSTQVIEAGIDLDAGALVSELAPWSSLVQRAGRLNRSGARTRSPARLVWLDPGEDGLEKLRYPYELQELLEARAALLELEGGSFAPVDIASFLDADRARAERLLDQPPLSLLLRRPDLVDLFDTDPTLDGDDPDVGRFIRVGEDHDVGVAWRDLPADGPAAEEPLPGREEVCPVPISQRKQLLDLEPWRWSYARRRWDRVRMQDELVPGDLLLLRAECGGYDPRLGWTGRKAARDGRVDPIPVEGAPTDSDLEDSSSARPGRWIPLVDHTNGVVMQLEHLLASLDLDEEWRQALRLAAVAHDSGKAHREFQNRLERWAGAAPELPGVYAKAPEKVKWRPSRAFRHELVSALLLLERGRRRRDLDLAAYLVAAHHGKLRLTPRLLLDDQDPETAVCLGVREGDTVEAVSLDGETFGPLTVDLTLMRIGSLEETTWIERALDLLDRLGPFRLAYLEALLRAADQRASQQEASQP